MANAKRPIPHYHFCSVCSTRLGCADGDCEIGQWAVCEKKRCIEIFESATVHYQPGGGSARLQCCDLLPAETAIGDRQTVEPDEVTCPQYFEKLIQAAETPRQEEKIKAMAARAGVAVRAPVVHQGTAAPEGFEPGGDATMRAYSEDEQAAVNPDLPKVSKMLSEALGDYGGPASAPKTPVVRRVQAQRPGPRLA